MATDTCLKCTCSEVSIANAADVVAGVQKDQFNLDFVGQSALHNPNAYVVFQISFFILLKNVVATFVPRFNL